MSALRCHYCGQADARLVVEFDDGECFAVCPPCRPRRRAGVTVRRIEPAGEVATLLMQPPALVFTAAGWCLVPAPTLTVPR